MKLLEEISSSKLKLKKYSVSVRGLGGGGRSWKLQSLLGSPLLYLSIFKISKFRDKTGFPRTSRYAKTILRFSPRTQSRWTILGTIITSGFSAFCPRRNLNSVGDYSSSSVGVVCRVSPILKMGFFPNALS